MMKPNADPYKPVAESALPPAQVMSGLLSGNHVDVREEKQTPAYTKAELAGITEHGKQVLDLEEEIPIHGDDEERSKVESTLPSRETKELENPQEDGKDEGSRNRNDTDPYLPIPQSVQRAYPTEAADIVDVDGDASSSITHSRSRSSLFLQSSSPLPYPSSSPTTADENPTDPRPLILKSVPRARASEIASDGVDGNFPAAIVHVRTHALLHGSSSPAPVCNLLTTREEEYEGYVEGVSDGKGEEEEEEEATGPYEIGMIGEDEEEASDQEEDDATDETGVEDGLMYRNGGEDEDDGMDQDADEDEDDEIYPDSDEIEDDDDDIYQDAEEDEDNTIYQDSDSASDDGAADKIEYHNNATRPESDYKSDQDSSSSSSSASASPTPRRPKIALDDEAEQLLIQFRAKLSAKKLEELRDCCRVRELVAYGRKEMLVERLVGYVVGQAVEMN